LHAPRAAQQYNIFRSIVYIIRALTIIARCICVADCPPALHGAHRTTRRRRRRSGCLRCCCACGRTGWSPMWTRTAPSWASVPRRSECSLCEHAFSGRVAPSWASEPKKSERSLCDHVDRTSLLCEYLKSEFPRSEHVLRRRGPLYQAEVSVRCVLIWKLRHELSLWTERKVSVRYANI
jgi:hypothetical protein